MRRLFCYTLSARAIGATVSAGALHAQGWGFESLIAHHRFDRPPAMGAFPFSGPSQRDSNPQGCGAEETRKRFPAQHARAAGPKRKRAAKPHATSLIAHHRFDRLPAMGAFPFSGPSQRDSNPQGCGAEETRSVFQRSTRGAERRSGTRAAPAARGHPSSPTTELLGLQRWRPFLFQAQRMGFEPASTSVTKAVVKKWQK